MKLKLKPISWTYFGIWGLYFLTFWTRAFTVDDKGTLLTHQTSIWSDWPVHFTLGSSMAYKSLFLTGNPLLLGAPFKYHFLTNFLSALLLKINFPFLLSFVLPSTLFCLLTVVALFLFFKTLFKSETIAVAASTLFLLNGGTGFFWFFQDLAGSESMFTTLLAPPQRYTAMTENGIHWQSIIHSTLIPQRAFHTGFPLCLLALTALLTVLDKKKIDLRWMIGIGVILGIMPITHIHSFLAAAIILPFWLIRDAVRNKVSFAIDRFQPWLAFFLLLGFLALPLLIGYVFTGQQGKLIRWVPGWYAGDADLNFLHFWWRNWSFTPFFGLLGMYQFIKNEPAKKRLPSLLLFSPFWFIFILINLVSFQPWLWDNTKLLAWASLGISGLAAYFLATVWDSGRVWLLHRGRKK